MGIYMCEGVERVKADCESNKLTVTGKVDPTRLRERLEYKTKKKVELLSPQPKKDGKSDDKIPDDKKPKQEVFIYCSIKSIVIYFHGY